MIIDKNGILDIQDLGVKLSSDFTLDELKNNSHFGDFNFLGSNDDYVRYSIGKVLIDNLPFFINLFFYKNKISQIGICYAEYTYIPGEYGKNQKEIVDFNKKKHDEWMIEQHGATAKKYSWGLIQSVLDEYHGYNARISIRYNGSPDNEAYFRSFDKYYKG